MLQTDPGTVLKLSVIQLPKHGGLLGKFSIDYQLDVSNVKVASAAAVAANAHVTRFTVSDTSS